MVSHSSDCVHKYSYMWMRVKFQASFFLLEASDSVSFLLDCNVKVFPSVHRAINFSNALGWHKLGLCADHHDQCSTRRESDDAACHCLTNWLV
jgi:hypothetical protein